MTNVAKRTQKGSTTKLLKVVTSESMEIKQEQVKNDILKHSDKHAVRVRTAYKRMGLWANLENGTKNVDVTSFVATRNAHWARVGQENTVEALNSRIRNSIKQGKSNLDCDACYLLAEKKAKWLVYKVGCLDKSKRSMWQKAYGYDELAQVGVVAIVERSAEIRNGSKTASQVVGYAVAKAINPNRHYHDLVIFDDKSNDLDYARKVVREITNLEYSVFQDSKEIEKLRKYLKSKKCLQAVKVLDKLGYGYNNQEIAKMLKLSDKTVSQHVTTIKRYALEIK